MSFEIRDFIHSRSGVLDTVKIITMTNSFGHEIMITLMSSNNAFTRNYYMTGVTDLRIKSQLLNSHIVIITNHSGQIRIIKNRYERLTEPNEDSSTVRCVLYRTLIESGVNVLDRNLFMSSFNRVIANMTGHKVIVNERFPLGINWLDYSLIYNNNRLVKIRPIKKHNLFKKY